MERESIAGRVLSVETDDFLALVIDALSAGGSTWVRVRGASMLPTIPRGSQVRVDPLPAGGVRRGDVVLARGATGRPIAHRVWAIVGDRIWLKGDFRVSPDSPIRRADVIGLVSLVSFAGTTAMISKRASRAPREIARRWRAFARDVLRGV
jgi:signal peptidase I